MQKKIETAKSLVCEVQHGHREEAFIDWLSAEQCKEVYVLCEHYKLWHESWGQDWYQVLHIRKESPKEESWKHRQLSPPRSRSPACQQQSAKSSKPAFVKPQTLSGYGAIGKSVSTAFASGGATETQEGCKHKICRLIILFLGFLFMKVLKVNK